LQAVVCKDVVGWRDKARRLLVFSTDAGFHYAGAVPKVFFLDYIWYSVFVPEVLFFCVRKYAELQFVIIVQLFTQKTREDL
jgi:hypothetical protein